MRRVHQSEKHWLGKGEAFFEHCRPGSLMLHGDSTCCEPMRLHESICVDAEARLTALIFFRPVGRPSSPREIVLRGLGSVRVVNKRVKPLERA